MQHVIPISHIHQQQSLLKTLRDSSLKFYTKTKLHCKFLQFSSTITMSQNAFKILQMWQSFKEKADKKKAFLATAITKVWNPGGTTLAEMALVMDCRPAFKWIGSLMNKNSFIIHLTTMLMERWVKYLSTQNASFSSKSCSQIQISRENYGALLQT